MNKDLQELIEMCCAKALNHADAGEYVTARAWLAVAFDADELTARGAGVPDPG